MSIITVRAGETVTVVGIASGSGPVDPGWSGGIGQPGFPTHPIAPGGPPLGIWGPGFPYPDQGLPGGSGGHPSHPIYNPPYPSQGPGFPTHPIAPGGGGGSGAYPDQGLPKPPGGPSQLPNMILAYVPGIGWVWIPMPSFGGQPPRPDQGLPGSQPHPDQGLPGSQPHPDQGLPGSQPGVDNTLPPTPEPK